MIPAEILIIFAGKAAADWTITRRPITYPLGLIHRYASHLVFLVNRDDLDVTGQV